ncbi:MAG: ATP-binding protein [Coprothermobacterota bacterium]|nr:ATP-binding protein [Coprothermobacterota bacterium]
MYIQRTLETFVESADKQFPVLFVTGARQVGKTTFLSKLSKNGRKFVTLDDPLALGAAKEDPALFMQKYSPPVLIDEVQYAPELLPYIKMAADKAKRKGMFWLTGSQQFHLMKGVSESLAGRVAVISLMGLSRRELIGVCRESRPFIPSPVEINSRMESGGILNLQSLYRLIWRGSYPAIASNDQLDRDLFYSSYMQTYLQRDVRDLARVGSEASFVRFIRATAARTAQILNMTELARDADVAVNTAKNWISILLTSGIIYLLEPYFTNITKRLVKTPKLYFLDTGLCAYLTEWSSSETLEAGAMSGAILETWILSELLKGFVHNGRRAPFYYYRDKDQKEIDLLIIQDGTIYPLEFKKTASPTKESIRHFERLDKIGMPIGHGGIICLVQDTWPLTQKHHAIPVSAL